MLLFARNQKLFSILFFSILFTDIIFHNIEGFNKYRYVSKLLITTSLMIYVCFNRKSLIKKEFIFVILALVFSFWGDYILIANPDSMLFSVGISMYMIAKIIYSLIFSFSAKFDIDRSLPFLTITLLYSLLMIYFVYSGHGVPILLIMVYIFVSLIMLKVAYLRFEIVNQKSYLYVLLGCMSFIVSESIIGIDKFYTPLFYESVFGMFFYGLAQFLIVKGLVFQSK
jgi:uncharacterized membrane protein YhhN